MRCPVCDHNLQEKGTRSIALHRRYFAMLKEVHQHQEKYQDFNAMRKEVVMLTGRFTAHHHVRTNHISYQAASISFAAMDNNEFRLLVSQSIDVCLEHFATNMSDEQLWNLAGFF